MSNVVQIIVFVKTRVVMSVPHEGLQSQQWLVFTALFLFCFFFPLWDISSKHVRRGLPIFQMRSYSCATRNNTSVLIRGKKSLYGLCSIFVVDIKHAHNKKTGYSPTTVPPNASPRLSHNIFQVFLVYIPQYFESWRPYFDHHYGIVHHLTFEVVVLVLTVHKYEPKF